jgi:hypothetical protein
MIIFCCIIKIELESMNVQVTFIKNIKMIKFIRKIIKNGRGSYYINLPKEVVDSMKLRERQKMTLRQSGKKIILEDWE